MVVKTGALDRLIATCWVYNVGQMVKNLPQRQETRVRSLGQEDPGEGNGKPLQYFCLGNPMDRETQWATVHRVAKSQT